MIAIGSRDAFERYGIKAYHSAMPNGERRFRLVDRDGCGYVRTEAGQEGAWQKSHLHRTMRETYIVQSGWIAIALLKGADNLEIKVFKVGDIWTTPPEVAHNVYMPSGAVTHVVKHGRNVLDDWVTNADTELLDQLSKSLTEEALRSAS